MGMSVFGALSLDLSYLIFPSYPNFDTFLSSMLITFQVCGMWGGRGRGRACQRACSMGMMLLSTLKYQG
jgi:hypothetical protein